MDFNFAIIDVGPYSIVEFNDVAFLWFVYSEDW